MGVSNVLSVVGNAVSRLHRTPTHVPDPWAGVNFLMHADPGRFLEDQQACVLHRKCCTAFGEGSGRSTRQARELLDLLLASASDVEAREALIEAGVPTLPKVVCQPPGGTYRERVAVSLRCPDPRASIRYTTDGSAPTEFSPLYRRPFVVDAGSVCVRAIALHGKESSIVAEEKFRVSECVGVLPAFVGKGTLSFMRTAAGMGRSAITSALGRVMGLKKNERVKLLDDPSNFLEKAIDLPFVLEIDGPETCDRLLAENFAGCFADALSKEGVEVDATDLQVKNVECRELTEVVLRLGWTFPRGVVDYLDGSCIIYGGREYLDIVDFSGPVSKKVTIKDGMRVKLHNLPVAEASLNGKCGTVDSHKANQVKVKLDTGDVVAVDIRNVAMSGKGGEAKKDCGGRWTAEKSGPIVHSGDVMRPEGGHHKITVKLRDVPDIVTDLYFTLSAYHQKSLQAFRAPCIEVFDAGNSDHQLLSYSLSSTGDKSSLVLASLGRKWGFGPWELMALGVPCDGNVRSYAGMKAACAERQTKVYHGRENQWPLARLLSLWRQGRVLQRAADVRASHALVEAFELPSAITQHVMSFV